MYVWHYVLNWVFEEYTGSEMQVGGDDREEKNANDYGNLWDRIFASPSKNRTDQKSKCFAVHKYKSTYIHSESESEWEWETHAYKQTKQTKQTFVHGTTIQHG